MNPPEITVKTAPPPPAPAAPAVPAGSRYRTPGAGATRLISTLTIQSIYRCRAWQ